MVASGNVGVAFGLVAAAGLCTTIGAAIVWCASLAQPRLLAGSLGFAAGVMLYVSFAEIFMRKSVEAFETVSTDAAAAYRWSTLCFFGGMVLVAILDRIVHFVAEWGARRSCRSAAASGTHHHASTTNLLTHEDQRNARPTADTAPQIAVMLKSQRADGPAASPRPGSAGSADVDATNPMHAAAARSSQSGKKAQAAAAPQPLPPASEEGLADDDCGSVSTHAGELSAPQPVLTEPCDAVTSSVVAASCPDTVAAASDRGARTPRESEAGGTSSRTPPAVVEIMEADHHSFMLKKMGLLTALALFIHNFPEGLATFVGALADTKIGVGLAVAIAMHNIPEGICVAMPIYYATGSRWKGFIWAFLSGVSEPVGGLMGYLVLNGNTDLSFAIVFGIVAGMMVYISIKELIPTALRYDPKDSITTTCVVAGMVVMAGSLLLFTI